MSVDIYKRSAIGSFTKEHLIEYTSEWTGERFPDGRPHVPDDIIERMKNVTLTQAWGTCNGDGYEFQFEGGFTNTFMPKRPDCQQALDKQGSEGGHEGVHIHWTINMLVQGDVYVADVFGKIDKGAIIGDNLAASIKAKSGNGVVHDNGVRDIEGIRELDDFACFVRGWHPSVASPTIMLTGMNCPTRIGGCTVMPGDVVLGKGDAVMFIPAHLAEKTVTTAEIVHLRDIFGKTRLSEGKYLPGEIDGRWGDHIEKDFSEWLENHIDELPVPKSSIQDFLKTRTW